MTSWIWKRWVWAVLTGAVVAAGSPGLAQPGKTAHAPRRRADRLRGRPRQTAGPNGPHLRAEEAGPGTDGRDAVRRRVDVDAAEACGRPRHDCDAGVHPVAGRGAAAGDAVETGADP